MLGLDMDNQTQATPAPAVTVPTPNPTTTFPPISQLFRDSWHTFTKSIIPLLILNIIGMAMYSGTVILAVLVFFLSGAGLSLFQKGLTGISGLFSSPLLLLVTVIVLVVFIVISIIISSTLNISSILIVDSQGTTSVWYNFKKSFGLIVPLLIVSVLIFILTVGAFFVLILPALLVYFLLNFTAFEVILNNQRGLNAIKRSVTLVRNHFGAIVIRLLLLFLIYIVYTILTNILGKIGSGIGVLISILNFVVNVLLSWFSLAYTITLYKQARIGFEQQPSKGIRWMWILAIVGWLIAACLFYAGYRVISSGILNTIFKPKITTPIPYQQPVSGFQNRSKFN